MLEVELLGGERLGGELTEQEVYELCSACALQLGVHGGHVAVQIVDAAEIEALNAGHRDRPEPTDVLSFPIDGADALAGGQERELGDIVICPEHTADLREAIVHGMLHLLGMDHETDAGEMLALQRRLLRKAA